MCKKTAMVTQPHVEEQKNYRQGTEKSRCVYYFLTIVGGVNPKKYSTYPVSYTHLDVYKRQHNPPYTYT